MNPINRIDKNRVRRISGQVFGSVGRSRILVLQRWNIMRPVRGNESVPILIDRNQVPDKTGNVLNPILLKFSGAIW